MPPPGRDGLIRITTRETDLCDDSLKKMGINSKEREAGHSSIRGRITEMS